MIPLSLSSESGGAGVLLALGALAVLAWNWSLLRERPRILFALRAAAIILVAFCALQISLQRLRAHSLKPRLAILVDTGLTMGAADGSGKSRLARAVDWLQSHRRELSNRAEPVLYAGADHARRISWEELRALTPSAAGFDFGASARDVAEDGAASRLWLLSDGNSEGSGETAAEAWKSPVDALGVGPKRTARAVYLTDLQTPDFVFLHSRFPVSVRLEASNLAKGSVRARLYKGSAMLSELSLPVRGDYEVLAATFTASAESLGRERYRVELIGSTSSGSAAELKASRQFGVEVIRQKHRIMYLAGRPSFEYSHLRELLKSNPNFELVSFVILRNPDNISPAADSELSLIPFPAQEIFVQNLMQFDMFILENFAYWRFNLPPAYLEGLKRFVAQGGALLVIGGSNAFTQGGYHGTPLEDVLPVTLWNSADDYAPGLFRPKVAAPGHPLLLQADTPEESMSLWDALPPLDGFNRFASVRPGSTVLLAHPTERLPGGAVGKESDLSHGAGRIIPPGAAMPLLAIREFGKGKVMVLGTDSTWRWKLGGGIDWKTASFYGRFWSKAVQYLSGTLDLKKVKFSPLPDRMPAREPAVLTLHLFDESFRPLAGSETDLRVMWTPPDGRAKTVTPHEKEPGVFEIELTGLSEGAHALRAGARYRGIPWGEDQVRFNWDVRPPEEPLRREWLSRVADRSSGRYADLDRAPASKWLEAMPQARTQAEILSRRHVWNWSGWLWVIAGLLGAEWFLRRRWGYV